VSPESWDEQSNKWQETKKITLQTLLEAVSQNQKEQEKVIDGFGGGAGGTGQQ